MCRIPEQRRAAPVQTTPSTTWAGYAAGVWAVVFTAMSFWWALSLSWPLGGAAVAGTIGGGIVEAARTREAWLVAALWGTGVLKAAGAALALATVQPWGRLIPQGLLRGVLWTAGGGMVLYGGLGMAVDGLRAAGLVSTTSASVARWHFLLWDPWWLLGGVLFVAAAWYYDRA